MEERAAAGIATKRTGIDITQPLEFLSKTPDVSNVILPSAKLTRPQLGALLANDPPRGFSGLRKGDASATTRIEQSTSLENKMQQMMQNTQK